MKDVCIWPESNLGNSEVNLYGYFAAGNTDRTCMRRITLYCISGIDHCGYCYDNQRRGESISKVLPVWSQN